MDYEKKYKEALERARIYRDNAKAVEEYAAVARYENIFPELRESEDERIRKTLVEYFGPEAQLDLVRGVPIQKIRDWLEKQKEQKPAEWSEEDETIIEGACSALEIHGHDKLASKLKSLRPSWKPSEEQMNCLCAAVDVAIRKHNESVSGYKPARVLKSLYEDLKKL